MNRCININTVHVNMKKVMAVEVECFAKHMGFQGLLKEGEGGVLICQFSRDVEKKDLCYLSLWTLKSISEFLAINDHIVSFCRDVHCKMDGSEQYKFTMHINANQRSIHKNKTTVTLLLLIQQLSVQV